MAGGRDRHDGMGPQLRPAVRSAQPGLPACPPERNRKCITQAAAPCTYGKTLTLAAGHCWGGSGGLPFRPLIDPGG